MTINGYQVMAESPRSADEIADAEALGREDGRAKKEPLWYRVGPSYAHATTGHIGNTQLAQAYLRGYAEEM